MTKKDITLSVYLYGSEYENTARENSNINLIFVTESQHKWDVEDIHKKLYEAFPHWKSRDLDIKFLALNEIGIKKSYLKPILKFDSRRIIGPEIKDKIELGPVEEHIASNCGKIYSYLVAKNITTDHEFITYWMKKKSYKFLLRIIFQVSLVHQMTVEKQVLYKEEQVASTFFKEMNQFIKEKWKYRRPDNDIEKQKLKNVIYKVTTVLVQINLLKKA